MGQVLERCPQYAKMGEMWKKCALHFPMDGSQPFGKVEIESEQGISTSSYEPILFKLMSISNTPTCINSNYSGLLPTLPDVSKAAHSTLVTLVPAMMTAL